MSDFRELREQAEALGFPKPERTRNAKLLKLIRKMPCCICGVLPSDASHIKTRGSGGEDKPHNVVSHCRAHHSEWGRLGAVRFCERYPEFRSLLEAMGWELDPITGKLWHEKNRRET